MLEFKLFLINHDRYLADSYPNVEAALTAAKETCFEARIDCFENGEFHGAVGTWSPISGAQLYFNRAKEEAL